MKKNAFTLVEVAICIAIVSFVLISLVGLLSIGLNANQRSVQQARAIQAMNAVATGIWGMTPVTQGTTYQLAAPMTSSITVGSGAMTISWGLDENGLLTNANDFADDPNLVGTVYMKCTPPTTVNTAGVAYITAAWPGSAKYGASGWTDQQGFVETTIYFNLPTGL